MNDRHVVVHTSSHSSMGKTQGNCLDDEQLNVTSDNLTYRPKFPLPEEIRNLSRYQTVCQYCGVSYLVLSEIKRLEDCLARLQTESTNLQVKVQFYEEQSSKRSDGSHKFCSSNHEAIDAPKLQPKYETGAHIWESFLQVKKRLNQLRESSEWATDYRRLSSWMGQLRELWHQHKHTVGVRLEANQNELNALRTRLENATKDTLHTQQAFRELQAKQKAEREVWEQQHGSLRGELAVSQHKLQEECKRTAQLDCELSDSKKVYQENVRQLKAELAGKAAKYEELQIKFSRLQHDLDKSNDDLARMERTSAEMETDLSSQLQHSRAENNSLRAELQISETKLAGLREQLNDQMESSISKQQETLKESLQKLEIVESTWSTKYNKLGEVYEDIVARLHLAQHANEQLAISERDAQVKLEQNCAYINALRERITEISCELEKQNENVTRLEIEKRTLIEEHERISRTVAEELEQKANETNQIREENQQLQNTVTEQKTEITQLQAIVQRECEERDELSAALVRTREQLLHFCRDARSPLPSKETDGKRIPIGKVDHPTPILPPIAENGPRRSDTFKVEKTGQKSGKLSSRHSDTLDPLGLVVTKRRIAAMLSAANKNKRPTT
ncbi:hypothetical protein EG68_04161 [Paragonimus skrjabini miyazakii]|uniref:Uncharacterized protein n=1 Tax=Paragonimus skrjabini miyazakii TaxID=59628 RepID=A0A8S9YYW5_9TREM|nr:hypothetical protein EG68_04161 [Paragonimus skrjabini miyazakii]